MNRFLLAFSLGTCALATSLYPSSAHAATRKLSVSVTDARLVEPPSGQKSMIFQVSLSGAWPSDVDVYYSTADGPANAAANTLADQYFDYSPVQGTVTILAGTTKAQIEVPILADTEVEKDETFLMTLSDLAYADDPNNQSSTITLGRSTAKGTIVEAAKGVSLGGQVINYTIDPASSKFDTRAVATPLSGVSVIISGSNTAVTATTDSSGKYLALVRPGTYTVKPQTFTQQDGTGTTQTYSIPGRTVAVSTESKSNNFNFYGIGGTVGVPATSGSGLTGVPITIEARPAGASVNSAPVASVVVTGQYRDSARPSRGYRFFVPGLPEGKYTLTVKDTDPNNFYTYYYSFPKVTLTLPDNAASTRPDGHVEIKGTPTRLPSNPSSASGS